jgi:hypothetical protein
MPDFLGRDLAFWHKADLTLAGWVTGEDRMRLAA